MSSNANRRNRPVPAVLLASLAILFGGAALSLLVGATEGYDPLVFWILRVPRAVSAIAVGGGLAVAGALIQASLGNPLAEPYTIGVASAAALGAVIGAVGGTIFGIPGAEELAGDGLQTALGAHGSALWGQHPILSTAGLAFLFAMGALVALRAWLRHSFRHAAEVLLVGVVASFFFSAIATLIIALANPAAWTSALMWVMGALGHLSLTDAVGVLLAMIVLAIAGWFHWKPLDLMAVDEVTAESAGVDVVMFRRRLFVIVALITAISVSVAGIIGFVGLIVPHILRRIGIRGHFALIPLSFIFGAGLLLCSDVLARVVASPSEIPVGVVMAIVGAPFFLILARKQRITGP